MRTVYRVVTQNTKLFAEQHTYIVLAGSCGMAEKKALKEVREELKGEGGYNYACKIEVLGDLIR